MFKGIFSRNTRLAKFHKGAIALLSSALFIFTANAASAQVYFGWDINLPQASPIEIVVALINFALGILALIAVVIILYGGFLWMFSGGSEEKIAKAKAVLINAGIGLVIILSAWAITTLILNLLIDFTDVQDPPPRDPNLTCEQRGDCAFGSPFYISSTNPRDGEDEVPLCHMVAVKFSFPLNEATLDEDSFHVTIPADTATNPDGGRAAGAQCDNGRQCLSGVCSQSACVGDQLPGRYAISQEKFDAGFYPESDYFENTKYRVSIDATVQGIHPDTGAVYNLGAGDPRRSFTFSTGTENDEVPPTVNLQSIPPYPLDEAQEICRNPLLQVSFSESLDPISVTSDNVWLYGAGAGIDPSDALEVARIRLKELGGQPDDTFTFRPAETLEANTEYGVSLYSGDANNNLAGAITDACQNPLSGDFDLEMEGSPVDDFVDPASSGLDQQYCGCFSGAEQCNVEIGSAACALPSGDTCTLSAACADTSDTYVGFDYQWTWQTGETISCNPEIDTVSPDRVQFYSVDEDPIGVSSSTDSSITTLTGKYLYPFEDIYFNKNVGSAVANCFDATRENWQQPNIGCFVSNFGSERVSVRNPVSSRTGSVAVDNGLAVGISSQPANIGSPYIAYTSPLRGPVGQYVTIKGVNFIDYDPAAPVNDPASKIGRVFFDDVEAAIMCADGWGDKQVIVQVPEGFNPGDTPKIQVITRDSGVVGDELSNLRSNLRLFEITDDTPGPGICLLDPDASDTGEESVAIIGENFGDPGNVYFSPTSGEVSEATYSAGNWDIYNSTYDSQSVVTDGGTVSNFDIYDVTVENSEGVSNGLDYTIPKTQPPRLFEYSQCRIDADAVYLPNPRSGNRNACVNNQIILAFTAKMDHQSLESGGVQVRRCNSSNNGTEVFNPAECTTPVSGSWSYSTLNAGYLGGSPSTQLDGTVDVDGDGILDYYEEVTFIPSQRLTPDHYYQVFVSTAAIQESPQIALENSRSWDFLVRNSNEDCVADQVSLSPITYTVNRYNASNLCPDNFSSNGVKYTMRARQFGADCSLLRDDGVTYDWSITNSPDGNNIAQFGDDINTSEGITDQTPNGYQNVCVQGESNINTGLATVSVQVSTAQAAGPTDDSLFNVDYGYCTSDADCFTNQCQDTYCDLETNRCAPDITSFSPNTSADSNPNNNNQPDVGPLGCLTINGCYFGADRVSTATCTCESQLRPGTSCNVIEGSSTCLLPDRFNTCSLGETTCTLDAACSASSDSAFFADEGGLRGCTCEVAATQTTCEVRPGETSCVARGAADNVCAPTSPTYNEPNEGNVYFGTNTAQYPAGAFCGDTWNTQEVIAQVPETVAAGEYTISLESNAYSRLEDRLLSDTYDEETCSVGDETTPCLCQLVPKRGTEGAIISLFGYGFEGLAAIADNSEKVTFALDGRRDASPTANWLSDNEVNNVTVPDQAITIPDEDNPDPFQEGVRVENSETQSNSLGFTVSCSANLDCSTGCCSDGQCKPAEYCNACNSDLDCQAGSCRSTCVEGQCAPFVTSISPKRGAVGQPVTVNGCYFGSYYSPTANTAEPYSKVTFDGLEGPLACTLSDSWRNNRIIVNVPDGVFANDDDTTAQVEVTQVSNNRQTVQVSTEAYGPADRDGDRVPNEEDAFPDDQNNDGINDNVDRTHPAVFIRDASCSIVDIPVLCDIEESYGPRGEESILTGSNFYGNENAGYCTCDTDSLGQCRIDANASSCSITAAQTFFVNADDQSETCDAATLNVTTTYDPTIGRCVFDNGSTTCEIEVGEASCTLTQTESCQIDGACNNSQESFVSLTGSATYSRAQDAEIDWNTATDTRYATSIPDNAETGDVTVESTLVNGQQCVSNGINLPVTCNACGDCAAAAGDASASQLNCNSITNGDLPAGVGYCTQQVEGFCRASGGFGCCNTTSCVYDSTNADDGGTCVPQPTITASNPVHNADNICPNTALRVAFDQKITVSDIFDEIDRTDFTADSAGDPCQEFGSDSNQCRVYLESQTGDVVPTSDEIKQYVRIVRQDNGTEVGISSVTLSEGETELLVEQSDILEKGVTYRLEFIGNSTIVPSGKSQTGIISKTNGAAIYCTPEQLNPGENIPSMCEQEGVVAITFTTVDDSDYLESCAPARAEVNATNQEFVDADYTFISKNQRELFEAKVYAAGVDKQIGTGDDQEIVRIYDGTGEGFEWTYDWGEDSGPYQFIFDSVADISSAQCPVAGIIKGGSDTGACACNLPEQCAVGVGGDSCSTPSGLSCSLGSTCAVGDADYDPETGSCACVANNSCTINSGGSTCTTAYGASCTTNSPDGVCNELDSGYDSDTGTCSCAAQNESCLIPEGNYSCTTATEALTCSIGAICNPDTNGYIEPGFTEDKATQLITSGESAQANIIPLTDSVEVNIIGDGSPEAGWQGNLFTNQSVALLFCASYPSLVTFRNDVYDIYWGYCRGADPQASSYLPRFVKSFERYGSVYYDLDEIDQAYGSSQDFIYEVAFKVQINDRFVNTNDTSANNDTIAIRVYPNDLDGNLSTVRDSVDPNLWYSLNTSNSAGVTADKLDTFQSVEVGNSTYVAFSVYDQNAATEYPYKIKPYIGVLAYSEDAQSETTKVMSKLKDGIIFNYTYPLVSDCRAEQGKLARDTKRINDLGTITYLLGNYYYNDLDGNGLYDFPALDTSTYIPGLTNSVWPSWNSALANALGQALPTDPINEFTNAVELCPFNPPNLQAGDNPSDPQWTYFDEAGTCWDPVRKRFRVPEDSLLYLYQYNDSNVDPNNSAPDQQADTSNYLFALYARLEYPYTTITWEEPGGARRRVPRTGAFDPCREYFYNLNPITSVISESSESCPVFNYGVEPGITIKSPDYARNFQ